ncbi:hypothetical protein MMC18_004042 [Xylographa bjoerkii]|nr:hypothetical protein [Xylographa bjoerkii]
MTTKRKQNDDEQAMSSKRRDPEEISPQPAPFSCLVETVLQAFHQNKVVIISGGNGSGKTTQIPKHLLFDDLPQFCVPPRRIAVIQPQSVAAIQSAQEVARQLDVPFGEEVGACLGSDNSHQSSNTIIEYTTDSLFLQQLFLDEIGEELAKRYSAVILDDAQERSPETDTILALLHPMIQDLTIDLRLRFFPGAARVVIKGSAPYPVRVGYLTSGDDEFLHAAADMIVQIVEGRKAINEDILVFLPGEEDINSLGRMMKAQDFPCAREIAAYPLHGGMSQSEKQEVLDSHMTTQLCRVIMATNIAETSLTVQNIAHVIDTGLEKLMEYTPFARESELILCVISKGSANQRAGRTGRTCPGSVYRLYSYETYMLMNNDASPALTRSELARQMLGLRNARPKTWTNDIKFMDRPSADIIRNAFETLFSYSFIDLTDTSVTNLGRNVLRLGCDVRVAKMLLVAKQSNITREGLRIAAIISIRRSDRLVDHRWFQDSRSLHRHGDFFAYLDIWTVPDPYYRVRFEGREEHEKMTSLERRLSAIDMDIDPEPHLEEARIEAIIHAIILGFSHNIAKYAEVMQDDTYIEMRTGDHVHLARNSAVYDHDFIKSKEKAGALNRFPRLVIYRERRKLDHLSVIKDVAVVTEAQIQKVILSFSVNDGPVPREPAPQ